GKRRRGPADRRSPGARWGGARGAGPQGGGSRPAGAHGRGGGQDGRRARGNLAKRGEDPGPGPEGCTADGEPTRSPERAETRRAGAMPDAGGGAPECAREGGRILCGPEAGWV
ncbi:MAG: hypothetical protein AVDCRST_MAG02-1681, partial [uncultured Rubrobacteraceae bacterium]